MGCHSENGISISESCKATKYTGTSFTLSVREPVTLNSEEQVSVEIWAGPFPGFWNNTNVYGLSVLSRNCHFWSDGVLR